MERILIHNPTTHGHQLISCKYSFLNLIYICYIRTWIENILFRLKRRKVFSLFTLKKNVPLSFFDSFELFPRIFSLFICQQIFNFSFNISSCYNNIARGPTYTNTNNVHVTRIYSNRHCNYESPTTR